MRYVMAVLLALSLSIPAFAGFEGPGTAQGGFDGPGLQRVTQAAQVRQARDDAPCTLDGFIVERIGKEKYTFEDASGRVTVEIDDRVFGGARVTPRTRVRLVGEVEDEDFAPNKVDVRYLEVLN